MLGKVLSVLIFLCTIAVLVISVRWFLNDSGNPEARVAAAQAVAGFLVLLAGATWLKKKTKPKATELFTVSYMRLFGAVEVPLLMRLIGHEGPFPKCDEMPYRKTPDGVISEEMYIFWRKKWTYRKAMPVLNDLWSTYCGKRWAGVNLYFNSLRPTKEDLLTFCSSIEVDPAFCLAPDVAEHHKFSYDQNWYPDGGTGTKASDVAFLFVILQNKSGAVLQDMEVEWQSFKNPRDLRPYENKLLYMPLSDWPNPESEALNDQLIGLVAPIRESKKMALLQRDDSLIIVLSAYKANEAGLPEFYLTDVTVPIQISGTKNGVPFKQKIRKPYLDQALKVVVPNGWFHQ